MADCIFCKIADKEIPGKIIHEDDLCIFCRRGSQPGQIIRREEYHRYSERDFCYRTVRRKKTLPSCEKGSYMI